ILPASLRGGFARCTLGRIPVATKETHDNARILLRPEQVLVKRTSREGMSGTPDMLFGEVVELQFGGASCMVAVRLLNNPDPPDAAAIAASPLVLRQPGMDAPALGEIVRISVGGEAHVLA